MDQQDFDECIRNIRQEGLNPDFVIVQYKGLTVEEAKKIVREQGIRGEFPPEFDFVINASLRKPVPEIKQDYEAKLDRIVREKKGSIVTTLRHDYVLPFREKIKLLYPLEG